MEKYEVRIDPNGSKYWYQEGKLHRLNGPAVEYANGDKYWYIEGKRLSEAEFNSRVKSETCDGKVVEIDGIKYQLKEIKE